MEALGIEVKLLIGQIVNFLLLFIVLGFFLYKPLVKMLEDRRKTIAESLDNAKKIEENLAKSEAKTKAALTLAQSEARKVLEEAIKLAGEQKNKIMAEAQAQSDRIIDNAKAEAKSAKDDVVKEAKKELSEVVLAALDKIVNNDLTEDDKKKLTGKAVREI